MPRRSPRPFDSVPRLCEPRFSQSLERGLSILACFSPEHPVRGIADIAGELGMSRSTTHRYVITLVALGYLEQDKHRKYRLGLHVTDLGMTVLNATGLREHAHPYIEELRRRSSFTVSLAVLEGTEIVYVNHMLGARRAAYEVAAGLASGSRLPAYCTALGKVLLAFLPEHEQRGALAEVRLRKRTPSTITRRSELREELTQVRKDGLAVCDEELAPALQSIAVPVRCGSDEVVAALSMDSPSSAIRVGSFAEQLAPHLVATADQISARLGYRRPDEHE